MMMMMKREREVDSMAMANYLMLLSRGGESGYSSLSPNNNNNNHRVFECKTCNRQFSSFQALGGHRASHKKPRLSDQQEEESDQGLSSSPAKPKTHECSVCGLEFAIGQALGGHMRRHRSSNSKGGTTHNSPTASSGSGTSVVDNSGSSSNNRSKRVLFLDLNLTPFENDLEFLKIGQARAATPLVDCFN